MAKRKAISKTKPVRREAENLIVGVDVAETGKGEYSLNVLALIPPECRHDDVIAQVLKDRGWTLFRDGETPCYEQSFATITINKKVPKKECHHEV